MGERSSGLVVFQQDGVPAHWVCETVQLLRKQTSYFIGPEIRQPNSPDLNQWITESVEYHKDAFSVYASPFVI